MLTKYPGPPLSREEFLRQKDYVIYFERGVLALDIHILGLENAIDLKF